MEKMRKKLAEERIVIDSPSKAAWNYPPACAAFPTSLNPREQGGPRDVTCHSDSLAVTCQRRKRKKGKGQ